MVGDPPSTPRSPPETGSSNVSEHHKSRAANARGLPANSPLQKYLFKTAPGRRFLGIAPKAPTDGKNSLLANGFWGVSRHVNYLGEITQAVAVALAAGYFGVWMVWLYPAYYVALMITRQRDDDVVCRAKYGELWDRYTARVRWRIVPRVY